MSSRTIMGCTTAPSSFLGIRWAAPVVARLPTSDGSAVHESRIGRRERIGRSPPMRQQFIELADWAIGDTREHVMEPSERVHLRQFTRSQDATKLRRTAAVLPPRSLPKNVDLLRPMAQPRSALSVWLLSMDRSNTRSSPDLSPVGEHEQMPGEGIQLQRVPDHSI